MSRIVVIGAGLAGLSTVTRLLELTQSQPPHERPAIQLVEARRKLGGRAGAFHDPQTGEQLDLCQHVAMGCCTSFARWLKTWQLEEDFLRDRVLHFLGPENELCSFQGSRWLPAPLHLTSALWGLRYLTWCEKLQIAWTMRRLVTGQLSESLTAAAWFAQQRVAARVLTLFWEPVIVSALSESLERVSITAVAMVFRLAFWNDRRGYELLIPRRPLTDILQQRLLPQLSEQGVVCSVGQTVQQIRRGDSSPWLVQTTRDTIAADVVVVAVPWDKVASLLADDLRSELPSLSSWSQLPTAPIVSVHLWVDQPLTDLPHVVLPGRISQWLFRAPDATAENTYRYQVVISAAHELLTWSREQIRDTVWQELRAAFPERSVQLLRSQVIVEPRAVFAMQPGVTAIRPEQQTELAGFYLAGDWTATNWPATMESALRSGEQTAEKIVGSR
jgi:squalene-associated FAD-dependent desaturase